MEIIGPQDARPAPKAVNVISNILTANPDLDIIRAAKEGGIVGAVVAVKNACATGRIVVFGTDMSGQLADFLLADDNVLQAVTGQKPLQIGSMAIGTAVDALEGKAVREKVALPEALFTRPKPDEIRQHRKRLGQLTREPPLA